MIATNDLSWTPLLNALFDDATVGRCLVAPDGTVVRVNEEWLRSTGFTADRVLGQDVVALFPETRDMALAIHARARAGHTVQVPRHAQRVGGRETWWEGSVAPVPMQGGTGLLITAREVGHPGGPRPLPGSGDAWLRLLSECMPQIVCVVAPDGTIEYVNPTWVAFSGLSLEQTARIGWEALVHPDDLAAARACVRRAFHALAPQDVEVRYRGADGTHRWFLCRLAPIVEGARVVRFVGSGVDVEHLKRAQAELRHGEERLRLLVAQMPAAVAMFDRDLRYLAVSRRYLSDYRVGPEDVLGRRHYEVFPEIPDRWKEIHRRCLAGASERCEEEAFQRADGATQWVRWEIVPWRDAAGDIGGLVLFTEDVTERKRIEEALRAREAQFELLIEELHSGVALIDGSGRFTLHNRRFLEMFGLARDADIANVNSQDWSAWQVLDEGGRVLAVDDHPVRKAALTRRPVRDQLVAVRHPARGELRWMVVSAEPMLAPDGSLEQIICTYHDVTDRKRAEAALQASEADARGRAAELEAVLDTVPAAVWIARDPRGDRIDANRFGAELLKRPPGQNVSLSSPGRDRPRHFTAQRDGRAVPDDELPIQRAARSGEEIRDAELDIVFDDGEVRHLVGNAAPLRDGDGTAKGSVGAFIDITDRKRAEEALREADRRKTSFLAVLSHELRNPLAPIRNSLFLLDRAPPGSDAARRARAVLGRQTEHLTRLVDDLLDMTRIAGGKVELRRARIDAREIVRRSVDDQRAAYEQRGVALLKAASVPVWVEADAARLAQMVGNLLHNALKFTLPGGRVEAAVEASRGWCVISVRDTGVGIAAEDLARLFTPFAQADRTRRYSEGGLGIGLSLVRELAGLHGGAVRASSPGVGQGAEFVIELPLSPGPEALADDPAAAHVPAGVSVLIVEDNEDAASTLADVLGVMGNRVRTVGTGRAAVEAIARDAPAVLLCDIGLPDMTGYDVIRAVRASPPRARDVFAVALTGYAQPSDREAALAAGFDAHLPKPPPLDELQRLIGAASLRRSAGA